MGIHFVLPVYGFFTLKGDLRFMKSPSTTVSAKHLLYWSTEEKVTYILDDLRVHFHILVNYTSFYLYFN